MNKSTKNQEKSAENKKSYREGLHDLIQAHQTFQEELKAAREKIKKLLEGFSRKV